MKTIKMQLFGSFSLTYGDKVLEEEDIRSNKITRMLAFILMNRDISLSRQRLIEALWEEENRNPEGALKNLMYRLRNVLKQLGDEEFICTSQSGYRWNSEIKVETDYEKFEQEEAKLHEPGLDKEEKKRLCRFLLDDYKNNVTPSVASETWMLSKVTWYYSAYLNAARTLCEILAEEEDWRNLEIACEEVLHVDSFDEEFHCWLLDSLYGQKKYDHALQQYEKSKKLLYENLGVKSPEKLREVFKSRMTEFRGDVTDIISLLNETKEQNKPEGAFFCDYQIFRQIYRMEIRRMDRMGLAEHVLLMTLRKREPGWQASNMDRTITEGMDILENSIRTSLRSGDMATRYSPTQFIILLPMCTYESAIKVAERIQNNFRDNSGRRGLEVIYELAEATSV